jgi:hypothetical protein
MLLWMALWAGAALYGAVANVPVVQGVAGGTPLPTDGSGVTQPVSGTVTANQGTAGATKWLVDGSGVTQPVAGVSSSVSGTIAGAGQTVQITTDGQTVISADITFSGNWNASLQCSVSNNGTTWTAIVFRDVTFDYTVYLIGADYASTSVRVEANVTGSKYARFDVAFAYTAGTATIVARAASFGQAVPYILHPSSGTFADQAAIAAGAGFPGDVPLTYDPVSSTWRLMLGHRLNTDAIAIPASGANALITGAAGLVSNGTTLDRWRTANAAANSTGTGLAGAGVLGYDGANWQYAGINGSHALKVDGSAVTQPVSGTVTANSPSNSFANLSTLATTVVKSGAGTLHSITINTLGTADTATVYDNTSAAGTKIATINTTVSQGTMIFDIHFSTGLTVVLAGGAAPDITVSYQ